MELSTVKHKLATTHELYKINLKNRLVHFNRSGQLELLACHVVP